MSSDWFLDALEIRAEKSRYYYKDTVTRKPNKNGNAITVWFFETAILRVQQLKTCVRLELKTSFAKAGQLTDFTPIKSGEIWSNARYSEEIADRILDNINDIYERCYWDVSDTFDCCSRYVECSDNRRCTQPDKGLARQCMYKRQLGEGRIYFGTNRNIP